MIETPKEAKIVAKTNGLAPLMTVLYSSFARANQGSKVSPAPFSLEVENKPSMPKESTETNNLTTIPEKIITRDTKKAKLKMMESKSSSSLTKSQQNH